MMNAKQNFVFGLVGCGQIGKRHAEIISRLGTLAAVCDNRFEKALSFAKQYATAPYQDFEEMLEAEKKLEIIVICTPNYLHAIHSITSLKAGLHVLCEKPMALGSEDCIEMMEIARQNNKLLHIVKQNRFNPPIIHLKNLLNEHKLGRIFSISMQVFWNRTANYYYDNWRGRLVTDGGVLYTQFSHFLDILIYLFGEVKDVFVRSANFNHDKITEFDDTFVGVITFNSGVLGNLHFSTCAYQSNREGSLTVLGEKGFIKIGGQYLNKIEHHYIENIEAPVIEKEECENDYGLYKGSMSNHEKVYEKFLNALTTGNMLNDSLEESLLTVGLIKKMHESSLERNN